MKLLADNREYLMEKSSLINFIEKYRSVKMNHAKLKELWKKEIDKSDFDNNEQEVFEWFQKSRSVVK